MNLRALLILLASGCWLHAGAVTVVVTNPLLAEWARLVAGEHAQISLLANKDPEGHSIDPSPQQLIALKHADVLFEVGLGLEYGLSGFYRASQSHARRVCLGENPKIAPLPLTDAHHGCHVDPHVWFDTSYAIEMVRTIGSTLEKIDPPHASSYAQNTKQYLKELEALDEEMRKEIQEIPPALRRLISYHDCWRYFAKRYGFQVLDSIAGSFDVHATEPSAAHVQRIAQKIKGYEVPVVFVENTPNALASRITELAKMHPPVLLYTTVNTKESQCSTYLQLMRSNTRTIVHSLNAPMKPSQTKH